MGGGETAVHEMDVDHTSESPLGPFVVGVVLLGVGVLLLVQTLKIPGDGFDPQGPRFLPMIMVFLWLGLSVVYLVQHTLGVVRHREGEAAERFEHMWGVLAILVMLVVYAFILEPLGYVVATSMLFVGAARALSSRNLRRDVVLGVGMSLFVYLTFSRLLNVSLPAGVLGF